MAYLATQSTPRKAVDCLNSRQKVLTDPLPSCQRSLVGAFELPGKSCERITVAIDLRLCMLVHLPAKQTYIYIGCTVLNIAIRGAVYTGKSVHHNSWDGKEEVLNLKVLSLYFPLKVYIIMIMKMAEINSRMKH